MNRFDGMVDCSDHPNTHTEVPGGKFGCCPKSMYLDVEIAPCFNMESGDRTPINSGTASACPTLNGRAV